MAVTDRTVRRDIARLRHLGYGVESTPGPWGGYRLSPGARMPPLVLDDEEALAVAVALREAALSGVLGTGASGPRRSAQTPSEPAPTPLGPAERTGRRPRTHPPLRRIADRHARAAGTRAGLPRRTAHNPLLPGPCRPGLCTGHRPVPPGPYRHALVPGRPGRDQTTMAHLPRRPRGERALHHRTGRPDRSARRRSAGLQRDRKRRLPGVHDDSPSAALGGRPAQGSAHHRHAPAPTDPKRPWSGSAATAPTASPPTSSAWPYPSLCCPRTRYARHSFDAPRPS